jgi:hypothetical protein
MATIIQKLGEVVVESKPCEMIFIFVDKVDSVCIATGQYHPTIWR